MPIQIIWDNEEKTVLRASYIGRWTWEELYVEIDQSNALLDSVEHNVDIIHDWSQSARIPPDAMVHARNLIPKIHPRVRVNIHVGVDSSFTMLWKIFARVYSAIAGRKKFYFVNTIEEARALLMSEGQNTPKSA